MSEPGQGPLKWSGDPEKAFPARHPREPGGLRQDILDELADHLASALEHELEGQEDGNEDAAWGRVLERFGDPDAMARKLWWDQMRETIMREWIQTGVTFVMAVAVIAGLVLIMRLVAGVGAANEAMRVAMQQVAASNESLANAMAEQRADNEALLTAISGIQGGGAEKDDALELSTIEIVVRRGTPDGPPAPEVKVTLTGQGPGEETLRVNATLDASGRTVFERLYQGSYGLHFTDSKSQLRATKRITLFAGKGAGEHVIVVPDIEPRPVHIDMKLPAYGQDSKQLITVNLIGSWEHDDLVWSSSSDALIGHGGTFLMAAELGDASTTSTPAKPARSPFPSLMASWGGELKSLSECRLAGEVTVRVAELWAFNEPRGWTKVNGFKPFTVQLLSESPSGVRYAAENVEEILDKYAVLARQLLNTEHVPDTEQGGWVEWAAENIKDSVLTGVGKLPEARMGEVHDGAVYMIPPRQEVTTLESGSTARPRRIFAMALPDGEKLKSSEDGSVFIALEVGGISKNQMMSEPHGNVAEHEGNELAAYWVKSDWRTQEWQPFSESSPGTVIEVADSPFWKIPSEQIDKSSNGILRIPLGREWLAGGTERPVGIVLRWEVASEEFVWRLRLGAQAIRAKAEKLPSGETKTTPETIEYNAHWMTTEPLSAAVPGMPLPGN